MDICDTCGGSSGLGFWTLKEKNVVTKWCDSCWAKGARGLLPAMQKTPGKLACKFCGLLYRGSTHKTLSDGTVACAPSCTKVSQEWIPSPVFPPGTFDEEETEPSRTPEEKMGKRRDDLLRGYFT